MSDTPLDQLKQKTSERLEKTKRRVKYCDDLELGKKRHLDSRFKRVVEEGRVAVSVYLSRELADAIDEKCGPVLPGRKRVCRQISRSYMVELLLHQLLLDPHAEFLPDDSRNKKYSSVA